ncbi:hypothetical protein PoB_004273900 [Plakobranchus ocellatus]|uniref:Uncharacterized protein n=1 Tax=Plakobranchus ocellatus TaxID=259542 RepID=A0AAV4B835_9GAST|nr:hypothetical protein PoB_004273900 [Plakobranchus ocellatus]
MASSLLRLRVLVLFLTLISTASLKKKKNNWRGFSNISHVKKGSVTMEDQAEKVVLERNELHTILRHLFTAGKNLKGYSQTHGLFLGLVNVDPDLNALFDALARFGKDAQDSSWVIKRSFMGVNDNVLPGRDDLKRAFHIGRKDVEADKILLEKSISEAEEALGQAASKLSSREIRKIYQMLEEIDRLSKKATELFYKFSDDSMLLAALVLKAGRDIPEVRQEAIDRLTLRKA